MCQEEAFSFGIETGSAGTEQIGGGGSGGVSTTWNGRKRRLSYSSSCSRAVQLKVRPEQEVEIINLCCIEIDGSSRQKEEEQERQTQQQLLQRPSPSLQRRKRRRKKVVKTPPSPPPLLQHVGCIQRTQGTGENQPGHHRLVNIQASLLSVGELSFSLLPYSDNTPVRGQPHRLCSYQRHSGGCVEHILLDSLHLHNPKCLLEADRDRCGASGNRQDNRPRRAEICQVLPMGVLLPILSGKIPDCSSFQQRHCMLFACKLYCYCYLLLEQLK